MEGNAQQQKPTPLTRELTKVFTSYNKHSVQLKKNLKETNAFFREIRQNYSNACASTMSSASASLEAGRFEHHLEMHQYCTHMFACLKHPQPGLHLSMPDGSKKKRLTAAAATAK